MSYGTWYVEFEAKDFEGKPSDVVFDMESQDDISDCFWFELDESTNVISITAASDELWGISDEAMEDALRRLWEVHKATITGYVLIDPDSGSRSRGEWNNDDGRMEYAEGIDTADYSVEDLMKIQKFAESLKEGKDESGRGEDQ